MWLKRIQVLDLTSLGLSGLCVIHCLLLPLVVAALPSLGAWTQTDWIHKLLVSIAAPLTAWTLYQSGGWRKWNVVLFACIGLGLLGLAAFHRDFANDEVALSVVGALYVAAAHVLNSLEHAYRHRQAIKHQCHNH